MKMPRLISVSSGRCARTQSHALHRYRLLRVHELVSLTEGTTANNKTFAVCCALSYLRHGGYVFIGVSYFFVKYRRIFNTEMYLRRLSV